VPVDCGAIPDNLLENEFFGHEKGAYTGASSISMGLIEFAKGGTFFLDEVCELPFHLQAKLLRVLQERKFRRVGGQQEIEADVRIVAATNRDINQEVKEKRFRADLFYRLNVVQIKLPPLRDRREDIPQLVDYYVKRYSRELGRQVEGIEAEVMEVLRAQYWPGNVRELQNVLKRAIALCKNNLIGLADLPDEVITTAGERDNKPNEGFFELKEQSINAFEMKYLADLLKKNSGDVNAAANAAFIPRGTFYRLMKKHSLEAKIFRS